jgi:hypothetical protein
MKIPNAINGLPTIMLRKSNAIPAHEPSTVGISDKASNQYVFLKTVFRARALVVVDSVLAIELNEFIKASLELAIVLLLFAIARECQSFIRAFKGAAMLKCSVLLLQYILKFE